MTICDRFDREGLLQLEQGELLDEHFNTCPDCLAARRAYGRLAREIAELDVDVQPAPGWTVRVRERTERRQGWTWTRGLVPAGAIAALAVLSVWLGRPTGQVSLIADVRSGESTVIRGQDAHLGDKLHVHATTPGYEQAELRVYFNDTTLALRCSSEAPCARDGDTISAALVMRALGSYRPVLLLSNDAIPGPAGDLNRDAAAALGAGVRVEPGERVTVR